LTGRLYINGRRRDSNMGNYVVTTEIPRCVEGAWTDLRIAITQAQKSASVIHEAGFPEVSSVLGHLYMAEAVYRTARYER